MTTFKTCASPPNISSQSSGAVTQLPHSKAILDATTATSTTTTTTPTPTPTYQSAFVVETEAYDNSLTRVCMSPSAAHYNHTRLAHPFCQEQYDSACLLKSSSSPAEHPHTVLSTSSSHDPPEEDASSSSGITIGTYHDCHYVSGGVTSEVYRSGAVALKVIVETHNMEPHNPQREAKILGLLKEPCISLLETFRDQEQRFVLAMPYMPLTLQDLVEKGTCSPAQIAAHFGALFRALADIHSQGIIHRDVKPSAILLASPSGPAYLSDFGTAWHPQLSATSEPADAKILDIGTGAYRAPEVLFGDKSYGMSVDIWAAGVMLTECCRRDPLPQGGGGGGPIFESRAAHEDGNQLSLILSIFKTIGSPTPETWPAAKSFKTPPFEMYQSFPGKPWAELLEGINDDMAALIKSMLTYESSARPSAQQVSSRPGWRCNLSTMANLHAGSGVKGISVNATPARAD